MRQILLVLLALLAFPLLAAAADPAPKTVKVFILAGQSNMEGKAKLPLLDYQAAQPATRDFYAPYRKGDHWAVRDDVFIKFLDRKGKLTVGFGSPGCVGPELAFGTVMGEKFTEPVLLIKTAWGGRSLYRDFRPPSAGLPPEAALQKMLANAQKRKPATTLDEIKAPFGASYRAMIDDIRATLDDLKSVAPELAGLKPELAGLAWFQGWNDMIDDAATAEYTANLAHFIRDVRRDLNSPNLPFVIAQMGVDGANPNAKIKKFKDAEAAVLALPEFAAPSAKVALVKTDAFWDTDAEAVFKKGWREHKDEWDKVGSDYGYHYYGSARTYCRIGQALAESMIALTK